MVLELLVIGALMGILGQGARAIVGLKGMADDAKAQGLSPNDLFEAGRLLTSFLIGIVVGLASVLVYLKGGGSATADPSWQVMLAWAVSAYAGTDFLEGFISQYLSAGASGSTVQKLVADEVAKAQVQPKPAYSPDDAWKIVQSAFARLGKPDAQKGDLLSDLGYSGFVPVLEVWDAVNNQLPSTRHLNPSLVSTWQAKTTTVLQVVQAVEAV